MYPPLKEILSRVSALFDPERLLMDCPEIEYSLKVAGTLTFPCSVVLETEETRLHVFSDASSKAYEACAYAVTPSDTNL